MNRERAAGHPSLLVTSPSGTEREFVLGAGSVVLGRSPSCDIVLDDANASRRHAEITVETSGATIVDLGSTNGTWRNGVRLDAGATPLAHGDRLVISRTELVYVDPSIASSAAPNPEDPDERSTRLTTALAGGVIGRTLVQGSGALLCEEADAALLRLVVAPCRGPRLVIREGGETRESRLEDRPCTIGRAAGSDVTLRDPAVSASHARIVPAGGRHRIEDLGSSNGTLVNGVKIAGRELREGDTIQIGTGLLVYKDDSAPAAASGRRRPVVVVPGFGGTEFYSRGERLWPNVSRLIGASERRLREYWDDLRTGSIIREVAIVPGLFKLESFGRLVSFLTDELGYVQGRDLLEFPYDWRQDVRVSARALATAIHEWRLSRPDPAERIVLLAHSMGGLLVRYYLSCLGGGASAEHAIFLGTPHRGSTRSLVVALSGERSRPLGLALGKLHLVLQGFPALYQLLPAPEMVADERGAPFDVFAGADWLEPGCHAQWEGAREFRQELERHATPAALRVTSIFGYGRRTLARLVLRRDASGRVGLVAETHSASGDGTVLEASAVLDRSEIHPVEQEHGVLHADRDVLRRLRFELTER